MPPQSSACMQSFITSRSIFNGVASISILSCGFFLAGCATTQPQLQPSKTTLSDLHPGASRSEVLAEFGPPEVSSVSKNSTPVDVFKFVEGAPSKEIADASKQPVTEPQTQSDVAVVMAQTGAVPDHLFDGKMLTVQVNYDGRELIEDTFLLGVASR